MHSPALNVTAHGTGKRWKRRIEKGMGPRRMAYSREGLRKPQGGGPENGAGEGLARCHYGSQDPHEHLDQPGLPCPIILSVPFHSRTILSLCLIQIRVLTISEKTRNSGLCSFTIATTGKHPKAASAPPDE